MKKICIELYNEDKINLNLYEDLAPITVANFIHLIKIGFYNDTIFHRIIKGFMCQGGGYYVDNSQLKVKNLNYTIPGEFIDNGFEENIISHKAGVISMARTDNPNSANSQFFICDEDSTFLDKNYAAFGIVSDQESLDVVRKISATDTFKLSEEFANFPNTEERDITIKNISILQ